LARPIDTERRLVAIFAADVEGYSRLMEADEVETLQALTQRRAILDGLISERRGRIANTAGDSVLAEFGSAVDAVQCAVEAQAALAEANAGLLLDRHINFRIGVHVGDVMVQGGDLFGDGVNIAARLQTLASAGGTCISGAAHDQVRKILPFAFADLGAQQVKNIEEPVRAFSVTAKGAAGFPAGSSSPHADNSKPLQLPDKPSIAVLPFQNMSGDPEQEYFADGMVEDIITALSRVGWFFVIARNSSFAYKGKHVDIRQVGRELGVRYVLEGSIRKSGNRVRITGQLIEAANGNHIWADKFEGSLDDVFELQDRITETVVAAIEPSLQGAEIRRSSIKPTGSLDAYDLYLRALSHRYALTRESLDEAIRLLERAIVLDPDYAFAKAFAASIHTSRGIQSWATAEDIVRGQQLAHEALISGRDDPATIAFAAHAMAWLGREYDIAVAAMDRAIRLNPNSAQILTRSGHLRTWVSDADSAVDHFSRAIRLNPVDPEIGYALGGLAYALLIKGEYDKALEVARRAAREMPRWMGGWRSLVVASVKTERLQEAQEAVRHMLLLAPNHSISQSRRALPFRDERVCDMIVDALRKAGLPE
jgi:adenylate cyclase